VHEEIEEERQILKGLINEGKYMEAVKHAYADEFTLAIASSGELVKTHEGCPTHSTYICLQR
jgi:hypothetical protein